MLSGYTVAIVAVANIDTPGSVFLAGVNRGAAIVVGVAALMLFNDLLSAPDVFPGLLARIEAARQRVRGFARDALSRGDVRMRARDRHPGRRDRNAADAATLAATLAGRDQPGAGPRHVDAAEAAVNASRLGRAARARRRGVLGPSAIALGATRPPQVVPG